MLFTSKTKNSIVLLNFIVIFGVEIRLFGKRLSV